MSAQLNQILSGDQVGDGGRRDSLARVAVVNEQSQVSNVVCPLLRSVVCRNELYVFRSSDLLI